MNTCLNFKSSGAHEKVTCTVRLSQASYLLEDEDEVARKLRRVEIMVDGEKLGFTICKVGFCMGL